MLYPNAVYSVLSFAGFIMCLIPLPWHLEAWSAGTCMFMFWTGLGCFTGFVNSIIWSNHAINVAPMWCDFSVKVTLAAAVGIPAASLCINRRLYYISSVSSVRVSKQEKRRNIMVDLLICIGIPVLEMILSYISQGNRFNILERYGCVPATYNTPVAFALIFSWPVIIGLISAVYCIMTIRALGKRTFQAKELLSAHSNLNSYRYARLMCLAGIEILLTVPLASYFMYITATEALHPWESWAITHFDFQRIDRIPESIYSKSANTVLANECTRWSMVLCAFVFFAFFGFADEAQKHYRLAFESVAKKVGYTTSFAASSGATSSNANTLPMYSSPKKHTPKRDSLMSFDFNDDKHSFINNGRPHALTVPAIALELNGKGDFSPVSSSEFTGTMTSSSRWSLHGAAAMPVSMVLPPSVIARPAPMLDLSSLARLPPTDEAAPKPSRPRSII